MPDNSSEHSEQPEKTQSENISVKTIHTSDADVINPKSKTASMETPALQQMSGQGWKHYFFEFLMLFLAVVAGFFAENQRENYGENQQEKKLARRLLSDLREDSIFFETRINQLEERQKGHSRFMKMMTDPVKPADWQVINEFVPLLTGTSNDFTTVTYNQMKTSGTLRYIDNDMLTTSIQKYYDVLLAKVSRDADGADQFFIDYIIQYMTQHFRFQDFKSSESSSKEIKLLHRSDESDQELINIMGVWASNGDTQLNLQRPAQKQMLELINLIKKEYHLQ